MKRSEFRVFRRGPYGTVAEVRCCTAVAASKVSSALQRLRKSLEQLPRREALPTWKRERKLLQEANRLPAEERCQRRSKARWGRLSSANSKGRCCLDRGARVHVVVNKTVNGDSLHVRNGLGTIALCHSVARKSARVGDAITEISAKKTEPSRNNLLSRAYASAVRRLHPGERRVLSLLLSTSF